MDTNHQHLQPLHNNNNNSNHLNDNNDNGNNNVSNHNNDDSNALLFPHAATASTVGTSAVENIVNNNKCNNTNDGKLNMINNDNTTTATTTTTTTTSIDSSNHDYVFVLHGCGIVGMEAISELFKAYPSLTNFSDLLLDYAGDTDGLVSELETQLDTEKFKIHHIRSVKMLQAWYLDQIRNDLDNFTWRKFDAEEFVIFKRRYACAKVNQKRRTALGTAKVTGGPTAAASAASASLDLFANNNNNNPSVDSPWEVFLHSKDGTLRQVPEDWEFPKMQMRYAYIRWHTPDEENRIAPLKYLKTKDVRHVKRGPQTLGEFSFLMKLLDKRAQQISAGLLKPNMTAQDAMTAYDAAKDVLAVSETTSKGRLRCLDTLSWSTVLRSLDKEQRSRLRSKMAMQDYPNNNNNNNNNIDHNAQNATAV